MRRNIQNVIAIGLAAVSVGVFMGLVFSPYDRLEREESALAVADASARAAAGRVREMRACLDYELLVQAEVARARPYVGELFVRFTVAEARALADDQITLPLILRMINRESRWNPDAVGRQGEIGLLQVKPGDVGVSAAELKKPIRNVREGVKYLKRLRALYGDVGLAIAHYAGGSTAAMTYARAILAGGGR